ncbi:MAG: HAD family hydrolase [Acidobacteriota bacterium]
MKVQALIFDMDGVLVDSMPFHIRAWEQYLRTRGQNPETLLERMHGKHNDELVREVFGRDLPIEEVKQMGAEKEALYRELIRQQLEAQLLPGLRDFLRETRLFPKAVASNAEAANVDFVLEHANLRSFFKYALDGGMVRRGKPDPEIYLLAAEMLGAAPEQCIVFEDSQTGIDAALAAGMRVAAINRHRVALSGQQWEFTDFSDLALNSWRAQLHSCSVS